jgi:hypothetical protein
MTREQLLALLQAQREQALSVQAREAGDRSMCAIGRARDGGQALKEAEGRMVALGNLLRSVRRLPPGDIDAETFTALTGNEADTWRALLARHRASPDPAPDWIAYAEGGLEAMEQLSAGSRS